MEVHVAALLGGNFVAGFLTYWVAVCVLTHAGGQWELLTEVDELDLASTGPMADFLKEGFRR